MLHESDDRRTTRTTRIAAQRTRELALTRETTGLGHQHADDDVGTIATDVPSGSTHSLCLKPSTTTGSRP